MQGSLSNFSISILKINSQLKVKLNTNSEGDGEKVHTNLYTWGFFGAYKKNGVRVLRCLHHEQKIGSFENALSVSAITIFFTVFYIFRNNSSDLICPPISSLFFGFPCHFAKVNLVFTVTFDHEHLSNPVYLVFTRSFQLQPVSCTVCR